MTLGRGAMSVTDGQALNPIGNGGRTDRTGGQLCPPKKIAIRIDMALVANDRPVHRPAAPGETRMNYVQHVLQPDERVRFSTKLHWIIYLPGLLMLIPGVIVFLVSFGPKIDNNIRFVINSAAVILLALAVALLFIGWFRRWTTEIAVTSRRIIYKRGFIWRKTKEIALDKVESVDVDQSILGRVLGYGTLGIHGTGQAIEQLKAITAPITFRNHVTAE
jgi:membrane protein YdbS with pleckstrin-like domain